jgi:hypothetical protein
VRRPEAEVRWLTDEAGFDAAIDYKSENVPARLKELCPKGIDIFFDNVGGAILDAALARLAMRLSSVGAQIKQTVRKLGGLIRGPELRPSFRGLRSTGARKISEIGLPREILRLTREFSHGLQDLCTVANSHGNEDAFIPLIELASGFCRADRHGYGFEALTYVDAVASIPNDKTPTFTVEIPLM